MGAASIVLLGSTGSIGENVLRVAKEFPDRFRVTALVAGSNDGRMLEQIREFEPETVALFDSEAAERLRDALGSGNPRVFSGVDGILSICRKMECDFLVNAVVGAAGLAPTLEAIGNARRICLANKESLVAGGRVVMEKARKSGTEILPIDSEHSAIHQCLAGRDPASVRRLVLTASGGPFRRHTREMLENVTVEEALDHPTWKMGAKISIDSATLMNKGLEVIEAMHLFGVDPGRIDVVVHPQSVIHSLVEFIDGSCIAQLGETDMRHPIRYALSYPDRLAAGEVFRLEEAGPFTFEKPDTERFPCLALAYRTAGRGGTAGAVLNAANEVAVEAFLAGMLSFMDIPRVVEDTIETVPIVESPTERDIFQADRKARVSAGERIAADRPNQPTEDRGRDRRLPL